MALRMSIDPYDKHTSIVTYLPRLLIPQSQPNHIVTSGLRIQDFFQDLLKVHVLRKVVTQVKLASKFSSLCVLITMTMHSLINTVVGAAAVISMTSSSSSPYTATVISSNNLNL